MFAKSILLPALMATLAAARTDISGCTTTIMGQMAIYYVPDTGELCEFLNCGGGRAPPKTDVPGCAAYSGTATYSPQYLANFTPKSTAAAASSADATTSAAVVAPQPTSAAAAPSTDSPVQQAAASTAAAASNDQASSDASAPTDNNSSAPAAGGLPAGSTVALGPTTLSPAKTGVTTSAAHGNIAVTTGTAKPLTTGSRTSTAASGTKSPASATGAASKAQFWMGGAALALGAVAVAL